MATRNLDVRTIAAATAGLCLLAAAAAWVTQGGDDDGVVLLATPYELIIIEDAQGTDRVGFVLDTLDPVVLSAILIEDDEEWAQDNALADASSLIIIEDDRAGRLLAALVGSVGSVNMAAPQLPQTPDRVAIASPRQVAAPAQQRVRQAAGISSMDHEVAEVDSGPSRVALAYAQQVEVQRVEPLTADVIETSIKRQLPRVRACYERQLKSDSTLNGRMVLAMNVQPAGTVSSAYIADDQVGDEELTTCVANAVSTFQFPRGTESVAVEYPVNFKTGW
jgi:hypothetical protein